MHLGIEGGEDLQAAAVEILLTVIFLQLPADQVEKCREAVESAQHLSDLDEGSGHRLLVAFFVDDLPVAHDLQDHRPSLQAAFRVFAGIIVGRALDHGDEQGDLIGREIFEIAAEIELASQSEAMHGAAAVLAEVDLVGIGGQDFILAVMELQKQGHDGLVGLAGQGPLAGEEEVFHQLLGQGAAALDR